MEEKILLRKDIPIEDTWNLSDIFSGTDEWKTELNEMDAAINAVTRFQAAAFDAEQLLCALKAYVELSYRMERIYVYAHMYRDQDNADSTGQEMADAAQSLSVKVDTVSSFLTPAILKLDEKMLQSCISDERFEAFDFYLKHLLRTKAHVLSEEQEALLAMSGEIAAAPKQIYTMLNNADISFGSVKDEAGRYIELTKGRYIELMESSDREVRRQAFDTLYAAYVKQKNTIAEIYKASVKKDVFISRARNYTSSIQAALEDDNVSTDVYDQLISTVEAGLPVLHRYIDIKKEALQIDELHMYDIYVPLTQKPEMTFDIHAAKELVLQGLSVLGEDYTKLLKQAFDGRWIDVYESKGKTGGAYSWGAYGSHPYVLLNHRNSLDGVFTLAHEMGHANHSFYSNRTQTYMKSHYSIFVAEVASTLNEILMTKFMLREMNDPMLKVYVLNQFLEQFRGTVFRQTMFAQFEKEVHARVEAGDVLTIDSLNAVYLSLNQRYYGKMAVDAVIAYEWMRIPHFYNAFYVYQYATGFSAAAAIADRILNEGKGAVDDYLRFLSTGGSNYPIELLKIAGVDMSTSEPISRAVKLFDEMLNEFKHLL